MGFHFFLPDPFALMQGDFQWCPISILFYITVAEVLPNFINADKRIKGILIGDLEMKLLNFTDDTTIFLKDITCLNRIQVILKLYERASSSTFQKVNPDGLRHIKKELIKQDKWHGHLVLSKFLPLILEILFLKTPIPKK